jgi:hypothetical protein
VSLNQSQIAAIMAQQDQDVEAAKRWCGSGGAKGYNAQLIPLWQACCLDHDNELIDTMSRFALIGIRHVLSLIEPAPPPTGADGEGEGRG